jgi:uncharacterized membrane protein
MNRCVGVLVVFLICAALMIATGVTSAYAQNSEAKYSVIDVESWDVLYMRSKADSDADIVGAIPAHGSGITIVPRSSAKGTWLHVDYHGARGWVNSRYLASGRQQTGVPSTLATRLNCAGTEPFWSLDIADGQAKFSPAGEKDVLYYTNVAKIAVNRSSTWAIEARESANAEIATILVRGTGQCNDGMSDKEYAYEVFADFSGGPVVNGCCSAY